MTPVTIDHNPACATSRNVLALIRNSGGKPTVIAYLKTPPDRAMLMGLIKRMGIPVRALQRQRRMPHAELGLDDPSLPDAALLERMLELPILINRPIVVTPMGVLPDPQRGAFSKEDGEPVVDAQGRRVAKPRT